jgi:transposase
MRHAEDSIVVAGIDVAKAHLDVSINGSDRVRRFERNPAGLRELTAWLKQRGVGRAGLEASGGYERPVLHALHRAGIDGVRHQPLEVRLFARLNRIRAKNDRIDARLIATLTADARTRVTVPCALQDELAERLTAYEQVGEQLARLKTMCEHVHLDDVATTYAHLIEQTRAAKAALFADLLARIRDIPELARRYDLLRSLPGVGPVTAAVLIVRMPELGTLQRGQAAALIGVAPFDHDSGEHKGRRAILGGRKRPRRFLYIAALAARRSCPDLAAFAQRLKDAAKPPKLILVAIMRKLIEAANIVLKRQTPWTPNA